MYDGINIRVHLDDSGRYHYSITEVTEDGVEYLVESGEVATSNTERLPLAN